MLTIQIEKVFIQKFVQDLLEEIDSTMIRNNLIVLFRLILQKYYSSVFQNFCMTFLIRVWKFLNGIPTSYYNQYIAMELGLSLPQLRSLEPLRGLTPIYTIQQYASHKSYRAQCMIPFSTYSLKVVYIITFIAFKVYVRIEVYMIPMVSPQFLPIQNDPSFHQMYNLSRECLNPIPIANYSFNCLFCARCNLGYSCKSHVPPARKPSSQQQIAK